MHFALCRLCTQFKRSFSLLNKKRIAENTLMSLLTYIYTNFLQKINDSLIVVIYLLN